MIWFTNAMLLSEQAKVSNLIICTLDPLLWWRSCRQHCFEWSIRNGLFYESWQLEDLWGLVCATLGMKENAQAGDGEVRSHKVWGHRKWGVRGGDWWWRTKERRWHARGRRFRWDSGLWVCRWKGMGGWAEETVFSGGDNRCSTPVPSERKRQLSSLDISSGKAVSLLEEYTSRSGPETLQSPQYRLLLWPVV